MQTIIVKESQNERHLLLLEDHLWDGLPTTPGPASPGTSTIPTLSSLQPSNLSVAARALAWIKGV